MKKFVILVISVVVLLSLSTTSLAWGLVGVSVSDWWLGKQASATCYSTEDANYKFTSVELYKSGEKAGQMSYFDDSAKYTKDTVSCSLSKMSSKVKNGYAVAAVYTTRGGTFVDGSVAGVRHG